MVSMLPTEAGCDQQQTNNHVYDTFALHTI